MFSKRFLPISRNSALFFRIPWHSTCVQSSLVILCMFLFVRSKVLLPLPWTIEINNDSLNVESWKKVMPLNKGKSWTGSFNRQWLAVKKMMICMDSFWRSCLNHWCTQIQVTVSFIWFKLTDRSVGTVDNFYLYPKYIETCVQSKRHTCVLRSAIHAGKIFATLSARRFAWQLIPENIATCPLANHRNNADTSKHFTCQSVHSFSQNYELLNPNQISSIYYSDTLLLRTKRLSTKL